MECAHRTGSPNVHRAGESERSESLLERARARMAPGSFGGWAGAQYGTARTLWETGDGRPPCLCGYWAGPSKGGGPVVSQPADREGMGSKKQMFLRIVWLTAVQEGRKKCHVADLFQLVIEFIWSYASLLIQILVNGYFPI